MWRPLHLAAALEEVMPVKPIPDGYPSVVPYLVVTAAADVVAFMKNALGAGDGAHVSRRPDGTIMHAEVKIGDSVVMVGETPNASDATPATLFMYVPDVDAIYARALAAGGTSLREPSDQIYGDRTAGVRDPAGNRWWFGTHVEDVSEEELQRRMSTARKD
jgi:PhnB protein